MQQKWKRLPDTELEVMLALWRAQQQAPRSWLEEQLKEKNWAGNTINTYLARLLEKGFVSCERKGKTNYYTPVVRQEDYLEYESKAFLSKLYGNSVKNFVASLCGEGSMNAQEIDELQTMLDELKRGS